MAKRKVTFGGRTFEFDPDKLKESRQNTASDGWFDYSKVARERASLNDEQVNALAHALEINADKRAESIGKRPEDTAYYQYMQAIKELTNEDGTVNYDPNANRFNPYSDGLPDETARKAFDSLSYKDQLMLEIGDNGKPKTPDFGDPNVDTSAYDRYQQALHQAEADAKAAAEAEKLQVTQEANDRATKAMEDLYKQNRGSYGYDPKAAAKTLKASDKSISLTQTELEDIYKGLAEQYDWDDDAYNAWANPVARNPARDPSRNTMLAGVKEAPAPQPDKSEQPVQQSEQPEPPVDTANAYVAPVQQPARHTLTTRDPSRNERFSGNSAQQEDQYDAQKAYDAYWTAKDAGASDDDAWKAAFGAVYTPEELAAAEKARDYYMRVNGNTAFMRTIAKLTGKDKIEHWARAKKKGSFENDAKYVINQAVQGIGDFVSGVATVAGLVTKAQIDTALAPAWFITNEGKRWTMDEARQKFGTLDTIMYIAETNGSGANNAYNQAGIEKASGAAQFIGGLARAFTSSMTSGIAGSAVAAAAPALTTTVDLSAKLGDKAPAAVKTLSKLVPQLEVGINQVPFLTQAFGSGYQQAKAEGYDEAGALVWGGWTALSEGIPESISWNWSSATGSSLKSKVYGGLKPDAAKSATRKGLKNLMSKVGGSGAAQILAAANAEGMEEVISNYLEWFGRKAILNQDVDAPAMRDLVTTYASGALLSAITQGFSYATSTPARKQAEAMVDGMMNGQAPTAEQVQALDDANNEEAARQPVTNEQLDELETDGLHIDEKIVEDYRMVNDAFSKAEQSAMMYLQRLQKMNEQGVPFGDPVRVAAVKLYADSRKELASASEKRRAAHAKYLNALDGVIADTEATVAEAESAQQKIDQEYAQWQYEERLQNDPQGVLTVAQELLSQVESDIAQNRAALDAYGMRADPTVRATLMNQLKSLEESAMKLQQMTDTARAAVTPTIAEQPTSEGGGVNTLPENGTPVQAISPDMEEQAQGYVATMRQQGATTDEIIRGVEEQAAAEDADAADVAFAEAVKAIVSTNTPSLAQTLIANNASTASEKTITDLLNRARQEGTDEAGIALARELLVNSGAVDNSADAIKDALRNMSIAPTAEERANIAATYGSYDTYRRAVAGIVPLGGVGKQGGVSIDQAIGALQQDFPGQVTGDDRAAWLYDFAQNNPKGRINYDGDLDADSAQLWSEIKADNESFFGSKDAAPGFSVPDFSAKQTRVSKKAAAQWVQDTVANGGSVEEVRDYAQKHRYTDLSAKGRQFWANVLEATQTPGVQAFKLSDDENLARDAIHLFTGSSPYTQGNGMQMQMEESTYRNNRKWNALKSDIQRIIGFTFSDEYYNGNLRRQGAIAYFEPAHYFVSSSDTNNMTAYMHEGGHALELENIDPDEVAVFIQGMPAEFLRQYNPAVHQAEAGAEMFRAWMLNPTSMEREYPNTFAGLRRNLGARRYGQLRETGNAIRRMLRSDPATKIGAALYDNKDKKPVNLRQRFHNAITKTMDSGFGLKKLDNAAARAGVQIADGGADARAAMARTSSQAIEALFFDGMYDRQGNRVACSLAECVIGLRSEEQMNTLNAYLEIKQALDRYEQNHDDWVFSQDVCTVAEARAYAQDIEQNRGEIVQAAQNIWSWLKTYRDTQLSTAIPQDLKDVWEQLNPHYIPQTRHFTNEIHAAVRRSGGVGGQGTGVNRRREGSTRDIVSPIDAIANMVARTKSAAMNHEVLMALQDYYDHDQNGVIGSFLHEIPPEQVPHVVPADMIRRTVTETLAQVGLNPEDTQMIDILLQQNLDDGTVFELRAPEGRVGDAIAITVDGNTRYYQIFDQDLLNALTHMPAQQLTGVLGWTQKHSSVIGALITSKNPAFALSNAARDAQEAYFTGSTRNPVVFVWDYLGALVDVVDVTGVVGNRDVLRQYRAMGGSGGLSSIYASDANINDLKRAMFGAAGDSRNAAKVAFDRFTGAIEAFNGGIETIPRLAEYKRQLRRGASYADAIKAAKNCTTDFSTSGTSSRADSALWRFFNASMQSTYKAARMFTDATTPQAQRQLASRLTAMVTVGVAGRALAEILLQMGDDDDTYAAMPDYIKDGYWVIPTNEKGKYVRIPLPNGALMTTVNSLGRRIGLAAMGIENGDGVGEVIGEQATGFLKDVLAGINPFGEVNVGNPLGSNFTLNPLIQTQTNTSWTGAPIVPASMENLSPALQYDDKTSEVAKVLGGAFNMSPMKIDYLISQNSGVIGELNEALTAGIAKGKSDGAAAGVGAGIYEFMLSRFVTDTAYSQQVTSAFYDEKERLQRLIEDVEETEKRGEQPYSPIFKNLNPTQALRAAAGAKELLKELDPLTKALSDIGRQATQAANAGDEEKARELRFKQQQIAAEATLAMANFFDKWEKTND